MPACSSSGVSIIITSAHLAASATSITGSFSPCAFFTPAEFLRSATATSLAPESRRLQFVGREHHHHVGPFGGFRDFHHRQLLALRLLHAGGVLAQRDRH